MLSWISPLAWPHPLPLRWHAAPAVSSIDDESSLSNGFPRRTQARPSSFSGAPGACARSASSGQTPAFAAPATAALRKTLAACDESSVDFQRRPSRPHPPWSPHQPCCSCLSDQTQGPCRPPKAKEVEQAVTTGGPLQKMIPSKVRGQHVRRASWGNTNGGMAGWSCLEEAAGCGLF